MILFYRTALCLCKAPYKTDGLIKTLLAWEIGCYRSGAMLPHAVFDPASLPDYQVNAFCNVQKDPLTSTNPTERLIMLSGHI